MKSFSPHPQSVYNFHAWNPQYHSFINCNPYTYPTHTPSVARVLGTPSPTLPLIKVLTTHQIRRIVFNCWENFVLIPICTFSALLGPHISTLSQLLTSNTVHGHLRYKVSSRTFFLLELELKLFDSLNTIFLHFMSTTVLLLVLLRDTTHTLDHTADREPQELSCRTNGRNVSWFECCTFERVCVRNCPEINKDVWKAARSTTKALYHCWCIIVNKFEYESGWRLGDSNRI